MPCPPLRALPAFRPLAVCFFSFAVGLPRDLGFAPPRRDRRAGGVKQTAAAFVWAVEF